MSRFTVSQAYQPTPEEVQRWAREAEYFAYQEPNQNAPSSSPASRGWGVRQDYKPPVDAVEHVAAMFKREVAGAGTDAVLRPEFVWSIFSVCLAHFLWLRTEEGARWLMKLYGVEEVPAFKDAYAYFYLNKQEMVNGEPRRVPIDESTGLQIRVFRSCDKDLDPPITSEEDETIQNMQGILRRARNPNANELIAEATPNMYFWVSEQIRDWLREPQANHHWPTYKSTRISGPQWARSLESRPGVLVYSPLQQVEMHRGRAYRLQDKDKTVIWCGGQDIRVMRRDDYDRAYNGLSEHNIEGIYRCSSCGKVRACTPVTKHQKMCCHCFGSIVEKDLRPTLDWCTMKECKHCTEHLETSSDLINLKSRLNREATFPVRR
jgi:hypothetical protein